MQIIKSTDPIPVEHPVVLVYGQPGVGKTSLGFSAKAPLLLDFDSGAHRAINRQDVVRITTWADVADLMTQTVVLDRYSTIVVDTVGRLLDVMTMDILETTPKHGRDGNLTQQGWGVLKSRFRLWLTQLKAMGKDVLLLAHHREEKDGDVTQIRPDITGGSYGEVLKSADAVAFLAMVGRNRVLDANPSDRAVGKNPVQWKPLVVPVGDKATTMLAGLFDEARKALGQISASSAAVADQVQDWKSAIEAFTSADDVNRAAKALESLPEIMRAQLRPTWKAKIAALGVIYDKAQRLYVAPAPVELPRPPAVQEVMA